MPYQFEREPRKDIPGLNYYRVVDPDRGLRLELKRRTQDYDRFWFWWQESYVEFLVHLEPLQPGREAIVLNVEDASLIEYPSRTPVQGAELEKLRELIPEAVEAFWLLGGGMFRHVEKVHVKATF